MTASFTQPRRWSLAAIVLAFVAGSGLLAQQQTGTTASATLQSIVTDYMTARREAAGTGLLAAVAPDRSDALSLDAARGESALAGRLLARLDAISPTQLTHDDWITWADLKFELQLLTSADADFWFVIPITPYSSPLRALSASFEAAPVKTPENRTAYLDALNRVPVVIAAYEAKLRSQVSRGIVLPAEELRLVVPFLRTFLADPPRSAFSVADARLDGVAADDAAAFRRNVDGSVRTGVNPALERLIAFVDGPYRAHAPPQVGVGQYPGGQEYYQRLIHRHTGLELTPQQIHEIGLAEVSRLNGELDQVRVAAGFTGTLQEFRTYLKTDKRFFPKSADDIGNTMMAAIRRIEPQIGRFFSETPKAPYGVKRLDEGLEQSMTYGYYQVPTADDPMGYYRFNGSRPESRSLLMAPATIYHELIPGHHFQLALRRENTTLGPFRRSLMHTAFTEGWAEYASDLAGAMGMYDDPYARAGRLAMDLFLSTRLVVDTGMNALGWSRDRALAYMRDNTLESDVQIDTETLRYSADMPGQALAYKMGARKIHELVDRTRAAQGEAFDIRKFHAYLLDYGSMPLGVLDEHVGCYLQEKHLRRGPI
jgi:uncharacterized protein (DUF885 family)